MSLTAISGTPQPTLAWDFNGTTVPYIGTATSVITGAETYGPGKFNQAAVFNNAVQINETPTYNYTYNSPALLSSAGFTLAWWFNQSNKLSTNYQALVAWSSTSGSYYFDPNVAKAAGGQIGFYGQNPSGSGLVLTIPSGINTVVGTWYHVAFVVNAGTHTMYVNGSQYGTGTYPNEYTLNQIMVARTAQYNGHAFAGSIDDLRLYPTALTSTQVQTIYRANGIPSRGVQVTVQTPVVTRATNTTFLNTSNYSINLGSQYLTPSLTGVTVSLVFKIINSGTGFGGVFTLMDNPFIPATSNLFVLQTTNSETAYTYSTRVNGVGTTTLNQSGYTTNTLYYITIVINLNGSFTIYQNGGAGTSITSGAVPLPNKDYSIYLGTSHFNTSIWNYGMTMYDFFVVNATLNAAQVATIYQNQLANNNYTPGKTINWIPARASGAPLFSQLSSAAASSAVAAFSLRAVKGNSAKAVQVRRSSDDAVLDFWADRLGNLWTAPFTGQLLQAWLGSAAGYVITWYDQSGLGNNATGSGSPIYATSNVNMQWAIQSGTIMTVSSAFLTNTNFTLHSVTRRTTSSQAPGGGGTAPGNQSIYSYTPGNSWSGSPAYNRFTVLYGYQGNRLGFSSVNTSLNQYGVIDNTGCGLYSTSGPVDYLAVTWNGTTMQMYYNASTSASTVADTFGTIPSTNNFYLMGCPAYGAIVGGEFGEIIVFNTPLSGSDITTLYSAR